MPKAMLESGLKLRTGEPVWSHRDPAMVTSLNSRAD